MEGKRLLHSIQLKNLLSYGSDEEFELEPLNVLIGPNASGKSNLIEAIGLLAATPRDLLAPLREGGGAPEWLWKGLAETPTASLGIVLADTRANRSPVSFSYRLAFTVSGIRLHISNEVLEGLEGDERLFFYRDALKISLPAAPEGLAGYISEPEKLAWNKFDHQQSVLSQVRDPLHYPQLTYVADQFGKITIFRGWPFGRRNPLREPQRADLPDDFLLPDGSNLGLVLNDLQNRRATWAVLLEKLRLLYDGVEEVTTKTQGSRIQIFFHEEGLDKPIPATRLSDGTLHYLCLLTVLLHPAPPPLICIEEPELGLHPDVLPKVADLLLDAARRTQLIVTTHSETLVSRLSEVPESVVVCERDDRGTHLRRLEPEKLRAWLDKYMLGELWRMGEIGANRW